MAEEIYTPVKPDQFFTAWRASASEREKELIMYWSGNNKAYTRTIRSFLPEVAMKLNLIPYNQDYYTLDAIFYRELDEVHFPGRTYAKCIEVAIEHENELTGSESEMNKLQLFTAPLKVLITYANEDDRKIFLDRYACIVRDADVFGDVSTLRNQLLIFGEKIQGKVVWYPYIYRDGIFAEMKC